MFLHTSFQVLQTVIQAGSFTKAAQNLGITSAAVGKHIRILERKMNIRLFQRTTRVVTPTEAALKINEAINKSQDFLNEVLESLIEEQSTPKGRLRP